MKVTLQKAYELNNISAIERLLLELNNTAYFFVDGSRPIRTPASIMNSIKPSISSTTL